MSSSEARLLRACRRILHAARARIRHGIRHLPGNGGKLEGKRGRKVGVPFRFSPTEFLPLTSLRFTYMFPYESDPTQHPAVSRAPNGSRGMLGDSPSAPPLFLLNDSRPRAELEAGIRPSATTSSSR